MNTVLEGETHVAVPSLDRFGSWAPAFAGVTPVCARKSHLN
jgi:hypothetical protein